MRQCATEQEVIGHTHTLQAGGFHIADVLDVDALVFGNNGLARLVDEIKTRHLTTQTLRHQLIVGASLSQVEGFTVVERSEDLLRRHAYCLEQYGDRHLATSIDAEIQVVLGVEFEIEPRATVRNDAGGEQQLARAVRLAAVMLEEHTGGTMQLTDNDAFSAIDDKGTRSGHERNLAHVNLLLLDFLDRRLGGFAIHDGQAYFGAQRTGEGQSALLTFLDIERRLTQGVGNKFQTCIAGV